MPMFVSKKVYILAIDGDYIHLMPPEHKGMFDSVKTVNDKRKKRRRIYKINTCFLDIVSCKRYKKL